MQLRSSMTLMVALVLMVPALAAAAGQKEKVELCHIPPGNPGNAHTITVGANASNAHLGHGDELGECATERPGRVDDDDRSVDDDDDSSVDDDDDSSVDDDDDSSDGTTGENRPPVARARSVSCIAYDDAILLDGRSSSDIDGDSLDYLWTIRSHPSGSDLTNSDISDRRTARASVTPDRLGRYVFELEVTDPDGASDEATVAVTTHMDVELTAGPFDVEEGESTPVTVFFTETAPQDVIVQLVIETDVAVVVADPDDDAGDAISAIVIEEGDSRATVYLYGVTDRDSNDESTVLNAIVGSTTCGDTAFEDVEVEDDDRQLQLELGFDRFFYVRLHLEPWMT